MTTRSPRDTVCTAGPTASTTPSGSCPNTSPGSAPVRPSYMCKSVPQMALDVMRTTIFGGRGLRRARSVEVSQRRQDRELVVVAAPRNDPSVIVEVEHVHPRERDRLYGSSERSEVAGVGPSEQSLDGNGV